MAELEKLGTIDLGICENTPLVFNGRLYRLEYVRARYRRNPFGKAHHRLVDVATGEALPPFAEDTSIASALVEGKTIHVFGNQGGNAITAYHSRDLENWSSMPALSLPGWKIFNTSVCKGDDCYILAIEVGEPTEVVGVPFTTRFARSPDLVGWELTGPECVHDRSRYTACPTIRFFDGFYYMSYLAEKDLKGLGETWYQFETCLTRSPDLVHWEESPLNPVLAPSAEDKRVAAEHLTDEERDVMARSVDVNNSDIDYCEFEGQTFIYYTWNDQGQHGDTVCFLAHAMYDGTLQEWLESYFPAQ